MQPELRVLVTLDAFPPLTSPKSILLSSDTTVNKFRRECSKAFQLDILTLFNKFGKKVTDQSDLRDDGVFIASTTFSIMNLSLVQDKNTYNCNKVTDIRTTISRESPGMESKGIQSTVEVEFLSHSNSGKTSLIRSLACLDPQTTKTSGIVEVVYNKLLSVGDSSIHLSVTDFSENNYCDLQYRLNNKSIVVIVVSKLKLIDAIAKGDVQEFVQWTETQLMNAEWYARKGCFTVMAVTQFDYECDCEDAITQLLQQITDIPVLKISARKTDTFTEVIDCSQFWNQLVHLFQHKTVETRTVRKSVEMENFLNDSSRSIKQSTSTFMKILGCFF